jgi:hypothetical protein
MVWSGGRGTTGGGSPGRVTPGSPQGLPWERWDLGAGDAEAVLAEARRAFFVMATAITAGLTLPGTQPGILRQSSDSGRPAP